MQYIIVCSSKSKLIIFYRLTKSRHTIQNQQKSLQYATTKTFSSNYNKILYLISIIRNNLEKTKRQIEENENRIENNSFELSHSLEKEIVSVPTDRLDMSDLIDID